ncbi:MAG: cbb3-type cytochrome c oxidase subunit I [Candidatus Tectomicrobia bacterium]|uniref:Cbb3-type cytochrome c oxidase subunit I n=1 Tax=Tectimicrobiota bacterium TaxID=2528274 RepID=A0A932GQ58_UNCTE|nr:cbb3-type cytochrome c oxidase subunit I [Candidatus Tectomicrobia bacterium]
MSDSVGAAVAVHDTHTGYERLGFVRTYIFSTDHKMIGRQFLFLGLFMLVVGGFLAMLIRWELGWPQTPVPGFGWLFKDTEGVIPPEAYNMLFTMHATLMIFFVVMPIMVGCFGNFLIPLMIGARDMAFPKLNMLSFWTGAVGGVIMLAAFFVPGGAAASGWTAYAPLSAVTEYTGVDWGQNLWCISLFVLGISSLMGAINYITTVINMRAPGMTLFRLPLVIWSLFITAILLLFALPVLTSAVVMLLFDRLLGTHWFLPKGGGEPLLWQHLFWFFGHPEVYILVLPAMGVTSEVLSTFSRKPIFGYRAMAYSMIAIAFLSWIVWGHHMFVSGMNPMIGMSFMLSTMVIAVPSAIKTFNWLGTLWGGSIRFKTPMLHALGFVSTFVIGGLSGIWMANTPVDIFIHDTYFIVAHFHYVVAGIIFAMFASVTYWFPKMFGRVMNEMLGKIHFVLTFIFFNLTFFPMHILGLGGMMRRIYDPTQYEFLQALQPINHFMSISALLLGASQIFFIANFFWSLFAGKKAEDNPWKANTLEWSAPSPPPHGNWAGSPPTVHRGPYEYSSPEVEEDYFPQNRPHPALTGAGSSARVGGH